MHAARLVLLLVALITLAAASLLTGCGGKSDGPAVAEKSSQSPENASDPAVAAQTVLAKK